jgi:predicted nucleic acid-binding Zn ribbon protein
MWNVINKTACWIVYAGSSTGQGHAIKSLWAVGPGTALVEQTVALQRAGDCPAFKGERKRERQNTPLMGRQQALQLALLGPGPLDVF